MSELERTQSEKMVYHNGITRKELSPQKIESILADERNKKHANELYQKQGNKKEMPRGIYTRFGVSRPLIKEEVVEGSFISYLYGLNDRSNDQLLAMVKGHYIPGMVKDAIINRYQFNRMSKPEDKIDFPYSDEFVLLLKDKEKDIENIQSILYVVGKNDALNLDVDLDKIPSEVWNNEYYQNGYNSISKKTR